MSSVPPNESGAPALADIALVSRMEEIGPGGLRRRAARGSVINAAWLAAVSSLTLVKGVVVAAFLGTQAFGLWGLLTISFGTLFALAAVGLDEKYIQQDHQDQQAAFEIAFTLQTMLCGLFLVVGLIGIPLFSLLYDEPKILVPGLLLSLAFPLVALQTPVWVFYRRMDFLRQRILQSFEPVVSFFVTTGLAIGGLGLWALVIGTLAGSLVAAVVVVLNSPYKLRFRYEAGAIAEYARFSWPLLFGSLTAVLTLQIPIVVASRSLGVAAIGVITLATTISSYAKRVDDIVTQALYPAICAAKNRTEVLFETFSKSNRLALLWGFPCGIALALFGGDGIRLVLGEQWLPAVPVVQVFGVIAAIDQVAFNWTAFAMARGETRPIAIAGVVLFVVVTASGVPMLLTYGVVGFAYAMGAGTLAVMAVRIIYLAKLFPAFRILSHVSRAVLPTVPAAVLLLGERTLVGGDRTPTRVVAEVVAYSALVALGTMVAERALLREAVGYLRRAPAPQSPAPGSA